MRSFNSFFLWGGAFFGVVLFSVSGIHRFEAWTQVLDLWDADISPFLLLGHPHFFRYLVAYPGFLLEDAIPGIGFSIYIGVFFASNTFILRDLMNTARCRSVPLWVWILFFFVQLFMNGRGVIAWTAWMLCASLCFKLSDREPLRLKETSLIVVMFLLAAVSTGVFVVVTLAFGLFLIDSLCSYAVWKKWNIVKWATLSIPVVYVVSDYFFLAITKNLDFFGGGVVGIFNMLQHGFGRFFVGSQVIIVSTALVASLFVTTLFFFVINGYKWGSLQKLIILAVIGGLFGLTVLTLTIPLLLIYFSSKNKLRYMRRTIGSANKASIQLKC